MFQQFPVEPKTNDASWLGIPARMIELADPQPEPRQLADGSWEAEIKFKLSPPGAVE